MIKIKIDAGHTASGNPKRGWMILSDQGDLVDFVDEGYQGTGALSKKGYTDVPGHLEIEVAGRVYKEMLRLDR